MPPLGLILYAYEGVFVIVYCTHLSFLWARYLYVFLCHCSFSFRSFMPELLALSCVYQLFIFVLCFLLFPFMNCVPFLFVHLCLSYLPSRVYISCSCLSLASSSSFYEYWICLYVLRSAVPPLMDFQLVSVYASRFAILWCVCSLVKFVIHLTCFYGFSYLDSFVSSSCVVILSQLFGIFVSKADNT